MICQCENGFQTEPCQSNEVSLIELPEQDQLISPCEPNPRFESSGDKCERTPCSSNSCQNGGTALPMLIPIPIPTPIPMLYNVANVNMVVSTTSTSSASDYGSTEGTTVRPASTTAYTVITSTTRSSIRPTLYNTRMRTYTTSTNGYNTAAGSTTVEYSIPMTGKKYMSRS